MLCLVERCPGRALSWTSPQFNFGHRRIQDTILVLEEINRPLLWCPQCDMFASWKALKGRHLITEMCPKGAERKRRRRVVEEAFASTEVAFKAYRKPLEVVN